MKFLPSQYFVVARLMPAAVAAVPLLLIYALYIRPHVGPVVDPILAVKFLGDITVIAALTFLLVMAGRTIAKDIFERYWFKRDETKMPTTDFLLHSDTEYSNEYKRKVRQKITADFDLELPTAGQESSDLGSARHRIAEAVGLVRRRVGDGKLLLQFNIEYGFIRNLIGGAVIAAVASLVGVWVANSLVPNEQILRLFAALAVAYLLLILFSKALVNSYGKKYARTLFQEYLVG